MVQQLLVQYFFHLILFHFRWEYLYWVFELVFLRTASPCPIFVDVFHILDLSDLKSTVKTNQSVIGQSRLNEVMQIKCSNLRARLDSQNLEMSSVKFLSGQNSTKISLGTSPNAIDSKSQNENV